MGLRGWMGWGRRTRHWQWRRSRRGRRASRDGSTHAAFFPSSACRISCAYRPERCIATTANVTIAVFISIAKCLCVPWIWWAEVIKPLTHKAAEIHLWMWWRWWRIRRLRRRLFACNPWCHDALHLHVGCVTQEVDRCGLVRPSLLGVRPVLSVCYVLPMIKKVQGVACADSPAGILHARPSR